MVDLIDIGMGNVRSIDNALSRLGVICRVIFDPNMLSSNTIILPGVGSALPFMTRIRAKHFDKAIQNHAYNGNKIIGICLGFQVMTEFSEEGGGTKCLGLIKTETVPINRYHSYSNHNQWERFYLRREELHLQENFDSILRSKRIIINGRVFYNHEYGVKIPHGDQNFKQINSNSLSSFASMYCSGNIIGIQFHPEKSQITGLELLSMLL